MSTTSIPRGRSMRAIKGPDPCSPSPSSFSSLSSESERSTSSTSSRCSRSKPKPRALKTAAPPPPGEHAAYRTEAERFELLRAHLWIASFSAVGAICAACRRRILADIRSSGRFVIPNFIRHTEEKCKARRRIEKGERAFPQPKASEASLMDDERKGRTGVKFEVYEGGAPRPGTVLKKKSSRKEVTVTAKMEVDENNDHDLTDSNVEVEGKSSMELRAAPFFSLAPTVICTPQTTCLPLQSTHIPSPSAYRLQIAPSQPSPNLSSTIRDRSPSMTLGERTPFEIPREVAPFATLRARSPFTIDESLSTGMSPAQWDSDCSDDDDEPMNDEPIVSAFRMYHGDLRVTQRLSEERSTASSMFE
ncbi:hypothetical protein BD626DRAFT_564359 [Schizophyllum amplum]|uniref:Uncharacterized protein n=1 Tax=Schizophyllum amplum TaxID=97359 RepID=A0A550CRN0_9AGAR|nr:hypothetical protein BD626DRAFT_564359 [Auriculariopsis ampla]